jgi:hypothetical protein
VSHTWDTVSYYEWDATVSVGSGGRQEPVTWVELRAGGIEVPWSGVSEIQHTDDGLAVLVEGRSKPVRVAQRSRTPYERAVLTVAGEQIAAARDQPGRP